MAMVRGGCDGVGVAVWVFRGRRAHGVAVEILGAEELHQRVLVGLTEPEPVA